MYKKANLITMRNREKAKDMTKGNAGFVLDARGIKYEESNILSDNYFETYDDEFHSIQCTEVDHSAISNNNSFSNNTPDEKYNENDFVQYQEIQENVIENITECQDVHYLDKHDDENCVYQEIAGDNYSPIDDAKKNGRGINILNPKEPTEHHDHEENRSRTTTERQSEALKNSNPSADEEEYIHKYNIDKTDASIYLNIIMKSKEENLKNLKEIADIKYMLGALEYDNKDLRIMNQNLEELNRRYETKIEDLTKDIDKLRELWKMKMENLSKYRNASNETSLSANDTPTQKVLNGNQNLLSPSYSDRNLKENVTNNDNKNNIIIVSKKNVSKALLIKNKYVKLKHKRLGRDSIEVENNTVNTNNSRLQKKLISNENGNEIIVIDD